jgi:hypothetical protein
LFNVQFDSGWKELSVRFLTDRTRVVLLLELYSKGLPPASS